MIGSRRLRVFGVALLAVACAGSDVNSRWRADPPKPEPVLPAPPPPRDDGRLPSGVSPTRYHLELSVDPSLPTFSGRARIGIRVERPTQTIVLHARGLRILTAAVSTPTAKLWARPSLRLAAHSKGEPEELVLALEKEIPAGVAEIDLEYEAPFGSNLAGLYRVESGGRHFAYTQFEPTDARRAFPCFDEPGFKVPVDLSVTVPEGMIAVANMPELRRRESSATKLTSFEFRTSPPLPTYLVAFAVGAFEVREGAKDPVPIRLVTLPGKSALGELSLEAARTELGLLADYFGERHPYPKLDIVAVPEFGAGAMENPGLVTFREELVLLDPARASLEARRSMAGIMAHELAHQWFGNLVTLAWWDDIWLNEAFATWMGGKIVDQWKPSYGVRLERVASKQWVMGIDSLASARRIRQPVRSSSEALEAFDGITYVKGAAVLGMVEQWLGEAVFQRGVRTYLARHRWGNATSDHLFAALAEQSGKDVSRVMQSFVERAGVPLVALESQCQPAAGGGEQTLTLSQREYRPLGSARAEAERPWIMPVCIRPLDGGETTCLELGAPVTKASRQARSCASELLPNAGEVGYFRYALPVASLRALFKRKLAGLAPAERVGLIGNAWALVKSGALSPGDYLALLDGLVDEDNNVVWDQVVSSLQELDRALATPATRPELGKRVARLVGKKARELGWAPRPGESDERRLMRKTLLLALGDLGRDPWASAEARALADRWLAEPASVDSDLAEVALIVSARRGDAALFDRIAARARGAKLPEERLLALAGLTAFDDPVLVEKTLGLVLDGTLKGAELRYVLPPLVERPAVVGITYAWLRAHFDALSAKLPTFVVGRFPWVAAGLCDQDKVEEASAFFGRRLGKIEGADKHLAQAVEAGKLCAALRAGQGAAATRALGGPQ